MNNSKHEKFLEDIVCRIIENWKNFTWDSKNEITCKFCNYVDEISPIRKVVNFSFNSSDFDCYISKKEDYIGKGFRMVDFKNKQAVVEKVDELIKNIIYKENKYITDFLIYYAYGEGGCINVIEEDTIDELINFLINVPEAVIIADKNLKKLITNNKLYKSNFDVINKDNICFLDEVKNHIIRLDFRIGSFNILNVCDIGVGGNELDYWFTMHNGVDLYFQDPFDKFISVYKNITN